MAPTAEPRDASASLVRRLGELRAELADLAFALERRGRLDAAEVANALAVRLGELRDADPAGEDDAPADSG